MVIAFLGVDGSGKSTIIENFLRHIDSEWPGITYVHFRPTFILKGGTQDTPVLDPHGGQSKGLLMSIIKLLYFVLEYNYAFHMYYKKTNNLVVFDRYYYDAIADPKRVKHSAPIWLARILAKFIPTPDITFYLHAPIDIMFERKKEIEKAELAKIASRYMNFDFIPEFHQVSTNQSINESVTQVLATYKNFKEKRNS